jgi:N-acyl-D-aspartate/D-glutamate deacylase
VIDVLIRGGTVVDGTGAPGRVADVGIRDGRLVLEPGTLAGETAARTIDATGLVVAPGVVDLHTHYDAQFLWDPTASPSPLHGVTTVIGGNCGFTLAPCGRSDADYLARMMSRVEGIPLDALRAGLAWDWHSFGEFLDQVAAAGPAVNCGFLVGHSALRRAAMGERCGEPARPADVGAMATLLHSALAAGGLGLSTSRSPTHNDGEGAPVPSRGATDDELVTLAAVVAAHPGTQLEAIVAGCLGAFSPEEVDLLARLSVTAGRPLNWNVLTVSAGGGHDHQLAASDTAAARGGRVVALTLPQSLRLRLSFLSGFVLDGLPGWVDVLGQPVPERLRLLADADVRRRLHEGADSEAAGVLRGLAKWERMVIAEGFTEETRRYEGRHVGEIAAERGSTPFDALCDIVVADGLRTGLRPDFPAETAETWEARRDAWLDPRTVVGASDAGAHLDLFCAAGYATFLLGPAVRDLDLLSLEEAVHQLTEVPARLYGLTDRGRVADGCWADLVLFDAERVAPGDERTVDDLPGGASRLTVSAIGVERVIVGGVEVVSAGAFTGDAPGRVLRSGRDTETVGVGVGGA